MHSGKRNKCNNFEHNNNKSSNNNNVKMCNMMAYGRKDNIISLKCHLSVYSMSTRTHTHKHPHLHTQAHMLQRYMYVSIYVRYVGIW